MNHAIDLAVGGLTFCQACGYFRSFHQMALPVNSSTHHVVCLFTLQLSMLPSYRPTAWWQRLFCSVLRTFYCPAPSPNWWQGLWVHITCPESLCSCILIRKLSCDLLITTAVSHHCATTPHWTECFLLPPVKSNTHGLRSRDHNFQLPVCNFNFRHNSFIMMSLY